MFAVDLELLKGVLAKSWGSELSLPLVEYSCQASVLSPAPGWISMVRCYGVEKSICSCAESQIVNKREGNSVL